MKHNIHFPLSIRQSAYFAALGLGMTLAQSASALDMGPFTLTGFAKGEITRASNQCADCQLNAGEGRHRPGPMPLPTAYPLEPANATMKKKISLACCTKKMQA